MALHAKKKRNDVVNKGTMHKNVAVKTDEKKRCCSVDS